MKTESAVKRWQARTLTVSGLLGAFSIVLGITPLGFIPVPTAAGHATIMHVPAILGAVLEGPMVGTLTGLIFGLHSFLRAGNVMFADPLIAIGPRLLIGVVTYGVYRLTRSESWRQPLVLYQYGGCYGPCSSSRIHTGTGSRIVSHGIPEVIIAVAITVVAYRALRKVRR